jgi:hypothetical protein
MYYRECVFDISLYCRWFRLGKFLAFWTGVSQTTVFPVRGLMLFSLKLEATRSSESWDKPEDFYLRLHEVWIFCWLEGAVQCVRTCVSRGRLVQMWYFQSRYN